MSYEEDLKKLRAIEGRRVDSCCMQVDHSAFALRDVQAVGIGSYDTPFQVESFAAGWHLIKYVLEGSEECAAGKERYRVGAGDLLVVPAGVRRTLYAPAPFSFLWIHLKDGEAYKRLRRDGIQIWKRERECEEILYYVNRYRQEVITSPLINAFHEIIAEKIHRLFADPAFHKFQDKLVRLVHRIQQDPKASWTIQGMAADCDLSKGHFHKLCNQRLGASPMRLVSRIRLEQGAVLLRTSHMTIDAIASECGFGSARAFSLAFTKQYGQRPGRFRKS